MKKANFLTTALFALGAAVFPASIAQAEVDKSQPIKIITPFSNTGSSFAAGQMHAEQLNEMGWNVTFQATGSCANGRNVIENSNETIVYIWEDMIFVEDQNDPCYFEREKPENMVDLWFFFTEYLCRVGDNPPFTEATGNVILGVNVPKYYPEELHAALQSTTNAEIFPIHYKDSSAIYAAGVAGEADYIILPFFPTEDSKEFMTCDYNLSSKDLGETQSFPALHELNTTRSGIMYIATNDLEGELLEAFKSDWKKTARSNQIVEFGKRKGWVGSPDLGIEDPAEQIEFIYDRK